MEGKLWPWRGGKKTVICSCQERGDMKEKWVAAGNRGFTLMRTACSGMDWWLPQHKSKQTPIYSNTKMLPGTVHMLQSMKPVNAAALHWRNRGVFLMLYTGHVELDPQTSESRHPLPCSWAQCLLNHLYLLISCLKVFLESVLSTQMTFYNTVYSISFYNLLYKLASDYILRL